MKPMAILGVLLIATGPLKVTADEQRTIPIPTIAGIVAVIAGAGLLFMGRAARG